MKKKLILAFLLLSFILQSSIIFAQPNNPSVEMTQELKRISESTNLTLNSILEGNYKPEEVLKDINFQKIRLNSLISNANTIEKSISDNLLASREYATIIYLASAYRLVVNGISLYMQDKRNINFLSDAIVSTREADRILTELIRSLENIYKVKIK